MDRKRPKGFRLAWQRPAEGQDGGSAGLLQDTSAQAMVEMALIAPLLFIILFGIMELALLFNAFQQVHYAAFVAARSAIVTIPAAYPKGPDEDREDPYKMAQEGNKTPKKDAMERAAEIAMIPVSTPITAVIGEGLGNLPETLSNLDTRFNQLLEDLGISGLSSSDLPFAEFFDELNNLGDLRSLGGLLDRFRNLGAALPPEAGRAYARFRPSDLLDPRAPGVGTAWAQPNIPGIRQLQTDEMDVPEELGTLEILARSGEKFITSMLATKARVVDPDTKDPLSDDHGYAPGEIITVRVTHYYNPKMPVVRKIFWWLYVQIRIREKVREYMEDAGLTRLPEDTVKEIEDRLTKALTNFLAGIDLPYYPIPIHGEATLQVEGDRWCSPSINQSLDPCPY